MDRKLVKILWQIHWAVNIAPNNNSVSNRKVVYLNYYGDKVDFKNRFSEKLVISPTPPVYCLNLVEVTKRLLKRYNKIKK